MKFILLFAATFLIAKSARVPRQSGTEIGIVCSSCEAERTRLEASPLCCKCVSERASCNNRLGETQRQRKPLLVVEDFPVRSARPGLMCEADCVVFGDCACQVGDIELVDTRTEDFESCPSGQKLCCNPVSDGIVADISKRDGLVSPNNPLGEVSVDTVEVCQKDQLAATQNFALGVSCGKRDSRVYTKANLAESYTNPGEWPWSVLIFNGDEFLGAGALLDNDIVVTVGHKVRKFTRDASKLRVRMGDWNPNGRDPKEEHPEITLRVDCVRLHPKADLDDTLAYNVAILKLENELVDDEEEEPDRPRTGKLREEQNRVFGAVDLRSAGGDAPDRDALHPEGDGDYLDIRAGLASDLTNFDGLGGRISRVTPSYINTVCLPQSEFQFKDFGRNCWVAAWGSDLKRQREVDLPLVEKDECERQLRPIFREKGVSDWKLSDSEMCAGGLGKDTCQGEGGAPLVCLDPELDQYFAVGLVNYGFGCNQNIPAVYVNLADPDIKRFITDTITTLNFCTN